MFKLIFVLRKRAAVFFVAVGAAAALACFNFAGEDALVFSKSNGKIIVVDPGHGEPDGGAVGSGGTVESTLNLKVAKKLQSQLTKRGYTVIMTRSDEKGLFDEGKKSIREKKRADMEKRLEIINNSDADFFVSIHMNMFRDKNQHGAEVIFSDKFSDSLLLAELIQAELKAIDPQNQPRSVKKHDGSVFLLKNARIPALLVECGFISNPREEALLNDSDYQDRIACAVCDGIVEYYRSIEGRKAEL